MTNSEEIKELKVGVSIKKLLWRVINAVFPYNEKEDGLSIKERSLLEDILLFKSFREIAALRGCTKTATSHGVRHLGIGASSPKMRIEKRKSARASVSSCLDGGKRKNSNKICFFAHLIVSLQRKSIRQIWN